MSLLVGQWTIWTNGPLRATYPVDGNHKKNQPACITERVRYICKGRSKEVLRLAQNGASATSQATRLQHQYKCSYQLRRPKPALGLNSLSDLNRAAEAVEVAPLICRVDPPEKASNRHK